MIVVRPPLFALGEEEPALIGGRGQHELLVLNPLPGVGGRVLFEVLFELGEPDFEGRTFSLGGVADVVHCDVMKEQDLLTPESRQACSPAAMP